jgi:hypothetical protein
MIAKIIRKSLQDIGSDLVANLSLLADFYKHTSDLTNWCGWVKAELAASGGLLSTAVIPALDGTEEASHLQSISKQWNRLHADALIYYSSVCGEKPVIRCNVERRFFQVEDIQGRYPHLLAGSRASWRAATGEGENLGKEKEKPEPTPGTFRKITQKTSNIMRDAVRHLACHGCFVV